MILTSYVGVATACKVLFTSVLVMWPAVRRHSLFYNARVSPARRASWPKTNINDNIDNINENIDIIIWFVKMMPF